MKICIQQCHALINITTLMGICISGLATCLVDSVSSRVEEASVLSPYLEQYADILMDAPERALEPHGRPLYPTTIEPPPTKGAHHVQQSPTPIPKNVLILSFDHDHRDGREKTMMALEALLKNTRINNIAFEFPGDLQQEFDEYFATLQGPAEMMKFAMAMIAHYPQAAKLPRKQRQECARRIMNSEGIHSLIDVAWIAKRHGAKVLLVDTPMAEVKSGDPKIALRNKAMSRKLMRFSGGKTMILLVGNAHTGHGTLGVSLDDQLTQLGASTMSICISTNSIPMRKDWGTDKGTADYHLTKTADIVSLVMSRVSETRSPGQSDQLATSGTNAIVSGLPFAMSRSASLSQR